MSPLSFDRFVDFLFDWRFNLSSQSQGTRLKRRQCAPIPKGVPRDFPPYLMRDIGLPPWPNPPRLFVHTLW